MNHELEIRKVLIVDDESDICDILSKILNDQNIQTEKAVNGLMALELLRHQDYLAVFCDIMMPKMTGLECLTQALSEGIITPFVFVTGFNDSNRMLQAIRLGAIDFIYKPFDDDDIVDTLF